MKPFLLSTAIAVGLIMSSCGSDSSKTETASAVTPAKDSSAAQWYIDVHHIGAGKVAYEGVAAAHAKDLAVQDKYGVNFAKYWVDEKAGNVYCLSTSPDTGSIRKAHAEAHGLLPDEIFAVASGKEAAANGEKNFFIDIHELGAGKVTAKDVEAAHQKDLAVQSKYGVNLINYWVDEKAGRVVCLSQAKDSAAIVATHKEAHGLLPKQVIAVKGN